MKQMLLFLSLMLLSMASIAQVPADYTLGKATGNVDCYYKIATCGGKTVVMVLFENKNTSAVTVTWKGIFATQQVPANTPGYWGKHVTIAPGISSASSCTDANHKEYIIGEADVYPTYRADITHFEFGDVAVTAN